MFHETKFEFDIHARSHSYIIYTFLQQVHPGLQVHPVLQFHPVLQAHPVIQAHHVLQVHPV